MEFYPRRERNSECTKRKWTVQTTKIFRRLPRDRPQKIYWIKLVICTTASISIHWLNIYDINQGSKLQINFGFCPMVTERLLSPIPLIPEPFRYFWSLCSFSINSPSGLLFKTQTVYNPTSWDAWEKSYCVAFPASHNNSFIILISILLHSRGQLTMEWMATTIWFKQTLVLWKTCITLAEPIIKWQLHSRWDWSTLSSHTVEQLLWKQIMEEQQHR